MIADPSHGTGLRDKVIPMARAAVAAGADGVHRRGASRRPTARCPTAASRSIPTSSPGSCASCARSRSAIGREVASTPTPAQRRRNGTARPCRYDHANSTTLVGTGRIAAIALVAVRARAQSPDATIDRAVAAWAKVKTVRGTFEQTVTNSLTGTSANSQRRLRAGTPEPPRHSIRASRRRTRSSPTAKSCGCICRAARRDR